VICLYVVQVYPGMGDGGFEKTSARFPSLPSWLSLWVREPGRGTGGSGTATRAHCPPYELWGRLRGSQFRSVRNQRTPRSRAVRGGMLISNAQVKRFRTRIHAEVFSPANRNTFHRHRHRFLCWGYVGFMGERGMTIRTPQQDQDEVDVRSRCEVIWTSLLKSTLTPPSSFVLSSSSSIVSHVPIAL
jgi:hypothetical protein